jgi:hypothetical protein
MFRRITGRWVSRLIYLVAKFELADELSHGPLTVDVLAAVAEIQA